MSTIIRVFTIDEQYLVRLGLCSVLAGLPNIEVVGHAGSAKEALRLCAQLMPDIILLDHKVSILEGVDIVSALSEVSPKTKFLVITSLLDTSLIPALLAQGVTGFFNKIGGDEELLKAIQLVHAGRTFVSSNIAKRIRLKTDSILSNPFDLLSERELQVALLLSYGVSQQSICEKLGIGISTLKTYRARFSEKLGIKNDVELTILASRHGLLVENK